MYEHTLHNPPNIGYNIFKICCNLYEVKHLRIYSLVIKSKRNRNGKENDRDDVWHTNCKQQGGGELIFIEFSLEEIKTFIFRGNFCRI